VKKSNQLLLRHTLPRVIIREEPFKLWGIQEKIHDGYLSVYVRHAGNITSFTRKGDDVGDFYSKNIEAYKNKKYAAADNLPSEYAWSQQYYKKLENLNQML
jgi:hypothetical protein